MSKQDAVSLRLNEPQRVDEPSDLHERRGREDLAEELFMRLRRLLPSANVGQHDPGANHIPDGAASLLDCAHHDLEAAPGLGVNVADVYDLAVTTKWRSARDCDPGARTDSAAEADGGFERRSSRNSSVVHPSSLVP